MSETTVSRAVVPGWFGKLPGLGDFASRRLPDSFVSPWDHWLQQGMACAREQLGDAWIEAYLVAPIWRFWVAPGTLGESGWAGLVMPSLDRVERHFPLTLALPVQTLSQALGSVGWMRALDDAARQVLDTRFTVDDLERVLRAIEPPRRDAVQPALADRLLAPFGAHAAGSVWWCLDAGPDTRFLCLPTLPSPAALAAMWSGRA